MKITKEAKIGVSVIVVLIMVYWGINFLKGLSVIERNNVYHLSLEDATGIEVSSALLVRGYKVGSVTAKSLKTINSNVVIDVIVGRGYEIPSDSYIQVAQVGIMDAPTLKLVPGSSNQFYKDGDTIKFTKAPSMMDTFNAVGDQLMDITTELKTTIGNVNKLLSEENVNNLSAAMKSVKETMANANTLVVTQNANLNRIFKNVEGITSILKDASPELKSAISNVNKISGDMSTSLPLLIGNINGIVEKLNSADGTIGKLLNDDTIYNDLDRALVDLSALLTDLKANPKRYVQLSLFGRKDKVADTVKNKKR